MSGKDQQTSQKLLGNCPVVEVLVEGLAVTCLLDTGSMVTTITEEFFEEYLQPRLQTPLQPCSWLTLRGANGLEIPYRGYVELEVQILGKVLPKMGILVVTATPDSTVQAQKRLIPGLLGMNVISSCYQELFVQHGQALFQSSNVRSAGKGWVRALSEYQHFDRMLDTGRVGPVRVRCGPAVMIPAGSLRFVPAVCHQGLGATLSSALLEPLSPGGNRLPADLLIPSAFLPVAHGTVNVPVVNVGSQDKWLWPKTMLGELYMAQTQSSGCPIQFDLQSQDEERVALIQSIGVESTPPPDFSQLSWPALSPLEKQEAHALLVKYQDAFSQGETDLGCTPLVQHTIPLLDDAPIRLRYRRLPPSQYELVKLHIQGLLEQQVIRQSCSPYSAPIVVVQKKDGGIRMCVDYRQLNAKTRKDAYPLPRIEESLDALAGAKWFSTLDLASGYNQVPMAEKDKDKTAFCTPFGLFEFNRMPFGLCNAPSTFQRLMERIFGDKSFHSLLLYLDDIVVFSTSFHQHLERLEMVLSRLQQHRLKLKLTKCHFFQSEVKYLGHVISAHGVATDPEKISAVSEWRRPTNITELRSFLGFASYYRRFVEGFAGLAAPLHAVVGKVQGSRKKPGSRVLGPFSQHWNEMCEQAFQQLKTRLVSAPVLGFADFTRPFRLEIDASHQGLGAILSQEIDGKCRPIAFASRGLRPAERNMSNYSSMKLEFLALKWAVTEKFREYLLGTKFTVYTDNNPLSYLQTAKLGAIEQRWVSQLALFNYEIHYRPGTANRNADALSRLPVSPLPSQALATSGIAIPVVAKPVICTESALVSAIDAAPIRARADLLTLQTADPLLKTLGCYWKQGTPPTGRELAQVPEDIRSPMRKLVQQWSRLHSIDGVLYRKVHLPPQSELVFQLLLPKSLQAEVLTLLHDNHGHQGIERTTDLIRQRCYWPKMRHDIQAWCAKCDRCALAKAAQPKFRTFMGSLMATKPLEILAIDFTQLEKASNGQENLLVVTDVFSKFAQAYPTADQKASTVVKTLTEKWFYTYGVPQRIHSDQGRNFEGELLRRLCQLYGITKTRTTPYHPAGNGQCERFNRTLHDLLRTLPPDKKKKWPYVLPELLFAYNTTIHQSTQHSPYELMFGQKPRLPVDFLLGREDVAPINGGIEDWVSRHQQDLAAIYINAQDKLKAAAAYRNRHHSEDVPLLSPGTLVYRRSHPQGRCKIQDCWNPTVFEVVECLDTGGRVYKIRPQQDREPCYNIHRSELKPIPGNPAIPIRPEVKTNRPLETQGEQDGSSEDECSIVAEWMPTLIYPMSQMDSEPSQDHSTMRPEDVMAEEPLLPTDSLGANKLPHLAAESRSPSTSPNHSPRQAVTGPSLGLEVTENKSLLNLALCVGFSVARFIVVLPVAHLIVAACLMVGIANFLNLSLPDDTSSVTARVATSRGRSHAYNSTVGKLVPSDATAQASEGVMSGKDQQTSQKLLGNCPVVEVLVEGLAVTCLLDTGSMVTTITEEFFEEYLQPRLQTPLQPCSWLTLRGANGLEIPYRGYVELEVQILGKVLPKMGILVVTATPDSTVQAQKRLIPGLLGMNVISSCYQELFVQHGQALFQSSNVRSAGKGWVRALSEYQHFDRMLDTGRVGPVRVRCGPAVMIPAGSLRFVPAVCHQGLGATLSSALLEPLSPGGNRLPADLLIPSAFLPVAHGTVNVPVVNVGSQDKWLWPKTMLGELYMAQTQSSGCPIQFDLQSQDEERVALIQSIGVESTPPPDFSQLSWPALSPLEKQEAHALLVKYQDAFSQGETDLGCTPLVQHTIPLLDDAPIRLRYRRLPPSQYELVKLHIQGLLEQQVIRQSCSPYSAPIVVVQKKDGGIRMCVDYRQLNAKTRKDAYPLPRIEESLDALAGAKWFSTLDLASGYNQVPMAEKDKDKTAFCTPFGLFEFNRMPFGLCNAPSTFQRLMERIFGDKSFHSLLLYLDDIVVFSTSFHQHLERLEMVLSRLQQHRLKLKLTKCHFFQSEVKYLGHVISAHGVATDPEKISAVSEWRRPTNITELRSFLGFASYYRRFVEGFAGLAAPLHAVVGKVQGSRKKPGSRVLGPFSQHWNEMCEQAFQQLKTRLVSAPVLGFADFTRPFRLEIDASHQGLGAILSQEIDGKCRPIAFASRGLRPAERNMSNYSSMKLEFLALKWAVTEKFREYLLGTKFTVYTDNNPLSYLQTAKLGASDQGRNFEGELLRRLCQLYGITKTRTTPYHPAGNGQCERFNRTLHDLLRTLPPDKKKKWPYVLPELLFAYNTTIHQSTQHSPYELMFGQKPRLPVDFLLGREDVAPINGGIEDWVSRHQQDLAAIYINAQDKLKAAAAYRNRHHSEDVPLLSPGTLVYRRSHPQGRCKIQDCWNPTVFEVVECLDTGGRVYKIRPQQDREPCYNIHRSELKPIPGNPAIPIRPEVKTNRPLETQGEQDGSSEDECSIVAEWMPTLIYPMSQMDSEPSQDHSTMRPEDVMAEEPLLPTDSLGANKLPHLAAESRSPSTSPNHSPRQAVTGPSLGLEVTENKSLLNLALCVGFSVARFIVVLPVAHLIVAACLMVGIANFLNLLYGSRAAPSVAG
ncbi:uncharacterized protein LOC134063614 [Sardina pilchardus]|uniref:uncharacterized protein LOC134063614 n=1 Tax=Sardina pilchardus TaxID=27697 RepID=UPI002E0D4AB2